MTWSFFSISARTTECDRTISILMIREESVGEEEAQTSFRRGKMHRRIRLIVVRDAKIFRILRGKTMCAEF